MCDIELISTVNFIHTHTHTHRSPSELRRRIQRDERKERLSTRVNSMVSRDRLHQQELVPNLEEGLAKSELSVPWLVLGFAVMVGYCVYYLLS